MLTVSNKQKINNYFKNIKDVILVYLYGSQARGEATADSDIDLAIMAEDGHNPKNCISSDIQIKAMIDLKTLLKKEVEVQNLNICTTSFAYRVISEGEIIYQKSDNLRVIFEEKVMRNYFDLKPTIDEYDMTLAERARRNLFGTNIYQI